LPLGQRSQVEFYRVFFIEKLLELRPQLLLVSFRFRKLRLCAFKFMRTSTALLSFISFSS
jgi:hypothetical protein